MNTMDLNIENYTYNDLLNVFRISNDNNVENIEKMKNMLELIKNNYSKEIYYFFKKAYNILHSIFNLCNLNIIDNIENYENINNYYDKIKLIKNLEYQNVNDIVSFLNDSYVDSYKKVLLSSEENLYSINNRSLYNNITTNKIDNTVTNSIAPGNINSIKRLTHLLNLNINSCFRSNYYQSTSCDFQYIIPAEIKNIVSMTLSSLELPNSLYLISKYNKNDFFEIIINDININEKYTIEIPEGNYTEDMLENYLNTFFFYQSTNTNLLKYIKFSIDKQNNKTSFEVLEKDIYVSLIFNYENNENNEKKFYTFGWLCGFRTSQYINVQKVVSEGLFDNGNDNYIYVIINDYQYNTNDLNIIGFENSILIENVIAKIPLKNNNYFFIFNENNSSKKTRLYNGPVNINKLNIKLIDKFGKIIYLNNMDISLTLEFEILYESFNFQNITD